MRIVTIGAWDGNGMPIGWAFDCGGAQPGGDWCLMRLHPDGRVEVGGVEIVEWTKARREARRDAHLTGFSFTKEPLS